MRSALSGQARERLEQELAALRDRRDRLAGQVRARDRVGDQADEAFSLRLDDDIAAMDDRIGELSELLASGRNVETGTHGVLDGTRVTLRFADGEVQTLQVVAVPEEIPAGQEDAMVTFDSPLGLALSGRAAGDTIAYSAPAGVVRAEIVSLEPPD
ncbi:MAG TPA: GreA/GreB family elongation factor [Amycolatopsis sp.]|uniref:GreA/GreB family elongation factor n=1 Tax=Amycolatopsis sp. TaxID=37632 RepID=UPI002B482395|nr:GreA/GreB family elongation factor [Amycolatopsis sp.]HKS49786.1 GreA/GreB family elongation factor [Amycolatopsis sp.]